MNGVALGRLTQPPRDLSALSPEEESRAPGGSVTARTYPKEPIGKQTADKLLAEADAGILFHAPDNVINEFPQFPAVQTFADLKQEFIKASNRNLSL